VTPWAEEHHPLDVERLRSRFPDDIVVAPPRYLKPLPGTGDRYRKGLYIDEWGCHFDNTHSGSLGTVREPVIANWADLERFKTPDCMLAVDREAVNAFCAHGSKFVLAGTLIRPFERYCFLRTMEHALADVLLQPAGFLELLRLLHEHYLGEVEAWAATDIDALFIMDDWGSDDRMVVAPDTWRRFFKPLYRDYCDTARRAGKFVFMHTDGQVAAIIADLIEVGVNALNSQVSCMGIAELGRRFRGRLTFWGEIDRSLLSEGSVADVKREVASMREHLWADGGVVAQCEFGPGAKPENVLEVFRAWDD